jgi:protein ATS1
MAQKANSVLLMSTKAAIFRPITLPLEDHGLSGYEISDVAACWETSFFLLTKDGQHDVFISMGGDDFGDLGVGGLGTANSSLPFHIINFTHIVGHTADRLSITNIATGPHHVIALLRAGNKQYIAGWGTARHGQLGPLHAPSGRALPFSPSPVAINLPIDVQLDPVRTVRAGNQHTLFLHASGRVSALGSDAKGQLRGLHTTEDVQAIGCSWNGSYYLLTPRTGLLSAGANAHGQLGSSRESARRRLVWVRETSRISGAWWILCAGANTSCACSSLRDTRRCGVGDGTSMATWRLGHWTT